MTLGSDGRRARRPAPASIWVIAALGLIGWSTGAPAAAAEPPVYQPAFHPDRLKGPPAGKPNEVLVLGTAHLSGMPASFSASMLTPLLDRLARWRPDGIAIEKLSGLQCDNLRRYPFRYASTVKDYCPDPALANDATGLDVPAANAEVERMLAAWPPSPSADERRHLAALFLAAGEPASALVQWLRLPPDERRAGDGLTDALAALLRELKDRRNEVNLVAAPLAARLGLERVWSVDDHSADSDVGDLDASGKALSRAWNNPATHGRLEEEKRLQANLTQPDGLMAMYRALNAPGMPMQVFRSDFGAALAEPSPEGYGRSYLAYWETRNLRMVANIREVLGRRPGNRLLAIVGASHKGYYEAYLNPLHDVRLVNAMSVLR